MRLLYIMAVVGLAACKATPSASVVTPPPPLRPTLGPPPCARPVTGGYMDDRLGTRCTFRSFRGVRVCVPDNMGLAILGICDPKGGEDRLWVNREPNCLGDGTSRYVLSTTSAADLNCDQLAGGIQVVDPVPLRDQVIYLGTKQTKCEPSALSGNPLHPIHYIAPPPAPRFIYEDNLPSVVCK